MTYGLSDVFADSKPCTIEDVKNTLLEKNISQLWTFLKGAAFYNDHQMLKYILDLNICTSKDFLFNILIYNIEEINFDCFVLLLDAIDDIEHENGRLLHAIIEQGDISLMEEVVKRGVDMHVYNDFLLHSAVTNLDFHMFKYLCELNIYDMHKNIDSILYFLAKSTTKKSVMIMEYMEKNYHDILDSANMRPIFDRCRRIASQHDNIYFMKIFKRYIKNG